MVKMFLLKALQSDVSKCCQVVKLRFIFSMCDLMYSFEYHVYITCCTSVLPKMIAEQTTMVS